jgi:protein-disulfide isomerase
MLSRSLLFATLLAHLAAPVAAQTPTCDAPSESQRALAAKILATEHPYDCCDGTIAACLAREKVCRLAYRLAENVCRRVKADQDEQRIRRALSRRAQSMLTGRKAVIDLKLAPAAGDDDAPVQIVAYACARCPFCSKVIPALHTKVTRGVLKGKARLHFKTFPIRGHEGSKEGGLALVAAARMGQLWPFLLRLYGRYDFFCPDALSTWAAEAGLDKAEFERLCKDPETLPLLVESKKEGIRNRVLATPTVFLEGRIFLGEPTLEELVDLVEELYDRKTGRRYR